MPPTLLPTPSAQANHYQESHDDKQLDSRDEQRAVDPRRNSLHTYHAVPPVSSDETNPDEKQQQSLDLSGSRTRLGLLPILPALVSFVVTASAASLLLAWVLTRRITAHSSDEDTFFHSAIVAAEGHQSGVVRFLGQLLGGEQNETADTEATMYGLAMSSVAVHTVSFTTPLVLSVFGYWMASSWIRSQDRRRSEGLPTPTQYGLIVSLLGSPNFLSAYDTISYISRRRRIRPAIPTMLIFSTVAVTIFLFINYALWICDLWFHTTSSTFSHQFLAPVSPETLPPVASKINTTLCPGPAAAVLRPLTNDTPVGAAARYANCLHRVEVTQATESHWGNIAVVNEGNAILSNDSAVSQVAVVDNLAIILPKRMPEDVEQLRFDTFGLGVACTPVTNCARASGMTMNTGLGSLLFCPSFSPPLNLSTTSSLTSSALKAESMVQQFDLSTNEIVYNTTDISKSGYHAGSVINPAGALVVLYWNDVSPVMVNVPSVYDNTSGWYTWNQVRSTRINAFYVASCRITVHDVAMSYSSPSKDKPFSLSLARQPTVSNFNTSSAFLGALDPYFQTILASHLSNVVQPSLNASKDELINALAGNLSVSMLGFTAPLAMRARASEGSVVTQLSVSRYPLAPLSALLALLYGYAFIALALCFGAVLLKSRTLLSRPGTPPDREIDVVHQRLTSVRANIADRFGLRAPRNIEDSISLKDVIFVEGKDTERLGMVLLRGDPEGVEVSNNGTEEGTVKRRIPRYIVDYFEPSRQGDSG
ncbi:hypothetical protein V5O48_013617 [Marasmius crinis-equi]|uniref:Uncharacterized protein n=1 Tax=Marasmius crinis-equi TaxID=585013 RepID=A0ABR3EZN0_9AGAR